jgi:hypothetical protein
MTTINAARRTAQSHVAANAYLSLEADARVAREVDLPQQDFEQARAALGELLARRDEINKSADIPSFYAYWRGRRNIEKGRLTPEVDKTSGNHNR